MTPLIALFLKLGVLAFGGPAAHIAMMEREVVQRRNWISRDEFLDMLGATNLIPGPNSTELAIHVGYRRGGWPGFFAAGISFILPSACIVAVFAWLYVRYGELPQTEALLYGVKPVMIAIIVQALWGLFRSAVKNVSLGLLALTAAGFNLLGVDEIAVLLMAGLVAGLASRAPAMLLWQVVPAAASSGATAFSLGALFLFFLKVGSVLFGSGYVLLAFLRADLVERWGWLTDAQLLDAIAVGQVTPGPVFTTATFIGYLLGGLPGAILATIGIFLPAFVFVALSGPIIPRLRRSPVAAGVLDGVNVAALAVMGVVTWQLGRASLVDVPTVILAALSLFLLFRYRVNSAWLILAGAAAGFQIR